MCLGSLGASAQETLQDARALVQERSYERALPVLRRLTDTSSDGREARWLLAEALEGLGEFGSALDAFQPLISRTDERSLVRAAGLCRLAGRPQAEAEAVFAIAELRSRDTAAWLAASEAYARADNLREQAAMLDRYLALADSDVDRWDELATLRHRLGHVVDEEAALKRLIALGRSTAAVQERLGRVLVRRGMPEEAAAHLLTAHDLDTTNTSAGWAFVAVALELDRNDDAAAVLKQLVERPGALGMTRERAADLLTDAGESDAAVQVLRPAAERAPTDLDLQLRFGELLLDAGHVDESVQVLERALALAPADRGVARPLAAAYLTRDQNFAARQLLEMVTAEEPADPDVELQLWLDLGAAVLATGPTVFADYRYSEDSNGYARHQVVAGARHQPLEWLAYRAAYTYSHDEGPSLLERGGTITLESHGALAGLTFFLAPRSSLDVQFTPRGYVSGPVFVGTRLEFHQTAELPIDFRVWLDRDEDSSTIDALDTETVRYRLATRLEFEFFKLWLLNLEGGYDHMLHTDVGGSGERVRNNGAYWDLSTGLGFDLGDVSLEVLVDYTGLWYQDSSTPDDSTIPYFAPKPYQTVGLPISVAYAPHWRVALELQFAPRWTIEDAALQLGYGAGITFFAHPRHRFGAQYERTDTLLGDATRPFQENVFTFSYTGAF